MELQQKRKVDIENNLSKAYELLNEYEQNLLYVNEPQERKKIEWQIDLLKRHISGFLVEADNLKNQIRNFEELTLEQNLETKSTKNQNELIDFVEKSHLLQTSRDSFKILQIVLEKTQIITQARQDVEDDARQEIEGIRESIEDYIKTSFKKELRENPKTRDGKRKKNDDLEDKLILNDTNKITLNQRISDEIEERVKLKVIAELGFDKKIQLLTRDTQLPFDVVQAFFEGEPIESHVFRYLCSYLNLNEYEIVDATFLEILVFLVPKVRFSRCRKIQNQCGTLRILDFSRPIELGDLYVDVNILSEPVSYRYLEISDLPKIYNPETDEVDRFGLGEVHQPRISGMNIIKQYSKLMILGKPGAGKSTFLQHLAIQCNQGGLLFDRIPIFIHLKTFSDNARSVEDFSLLRFIVQELSSDCEFIDEVRTTQLLSYGRAFILMDGLDEVSQEDSDRVVRQIGDFCEKYHRNKFVVTCRIAAQQYKFFGFTYVEVADFNQEQIEDFSKKFFVAVDKTSSGSGLMNSLNFVKNLKSPENSQIREISVTPILLTLTCLVFLSKAEFPKNRAQLYQDGIEILLLKWNNFNSVQRENLYENLSVSRKKDLLTYVASLTFEENSYFLKREKLESYIDKFLNQFERQNTTPAQKELGEAVLKSIEVQHGLLIERAQNIYSFSHLTFQEYFTARKYVSPDLFSTLATNVVAEKRWREVLLLSIDLIDKDKADDLLWLVKLEIDKMIVSDDQLQKFLVWLKGKSSASQAPFNPSTIRAFYLSLTIAYYLSSRKPLNNRRGNNLRVDRLLDRKIEEKQNSHLTFSRDKSLMSALSLAKALTEASSLSSLDLDQERILIRERTLDLIKLLNVDAVGRALIRSQFPNPSSSRSVFADFWKTSGETWSRRLRASMIECSNLGHDWEFSLTQLENLKKYYSANEYLLGLLDNVQNISSSMRSRIKTTMLLPIVDIQKYEDFAK